MKVIISRKGFDAQNGGGPSAIMPDGRLVTFPIPSANDPSIYGDVTMNGVAICELVEDLTGGRFGRTSRCHLDPDIDENSLPRLAGWRPSLGQIDSAQGHLGKQMVTEGDLFLFFGWYRQVQREPSGWCYVRGAPDLHVVYGWLRIGQIVRLGLGERPEPIEAFSNHPHMQGRDRRTNTLYVASDRLTIGGMDAPGAGIFPRLTNARVLTDRAQPNRSLWRLPVWMHPDNGSTLSYHPNPSRWRMQNGRCFAQSVAKGQEFVLRANKPENLRGWINDLFKE